MSEFANTLRLIRNTAICWRARSLMALGLRPNTSPPVRFVIEDANWAIRWVGENIRDEINKITPGTIDVDISPVGVIDRIVHFGSQYMWLNWGKPAGTSNRYVTSFFHGKREDGPEISEHIDRFLESVPRLSHIVASNSLVHDRLLGWGVPAAKVTRIPIGVDTKLFLPPSQDQRLQARRKFNIPDDAVVVGSFQKDGVGWGDGMEPKLIKGPDIFIETMVKLSKHFPVFAMLTGPARGYVKAGLEANNIPYAHSYPETHADLVECYHTLDLYLMSSREEGGPMGLMESMSTHVPVAATNAGMAPDLIVDGVSGALDLTISPQGLAEKAASLLENHEKIGTLTQDAYQRVQECDWAVVGRRHLEEIYHPLLSGLQ